MKNTVTSLLPCDVQSFENLVFVERIRRELNFFYQRPELSPQVMLFFGQPGVGKTSFATLFGRNKCADFEYYAMNECVKNHKAIQDLDLNSPRLSTFFSDDDKPISYLTILDEFHDLTEKQQDIFKVKLETLQEDQRVIICLNTTKDASIAKRCAEAVRSRSHLINFDPRPNEYAEQAKLIEAQFPALSSKEIERLMMPKLDMRKIARENKLRQAMNEFYDRAS